MERHSLERLAILAGQFTSLVSIEPDNALLMEIGASLNLFGSLERLLGSIKNDMRVRGHVVLATCAPTARAALWLAYCGREHVLTDITRLPALLAELPVSALRWSPAVQKILQRMGVRCIGECVRLPRDGLARRIGARRLQELDEGFGRRPEVREAHRPSVRFRDTVELPAETTESEMLLQALHAVLQRLKIHLQARQAAVQALWIRLQHRSAPLTSLRIGLLRAGADVRHLGDLVSIRISTLEIPAPVIAIVVEAELTDAGPAAAADLLGEKLNREGDFLQLIERLRSRLGFPAVHGIVCAAENRPELAWQSTSDPRCPGTAARMAAPMQRRPLWLFNVPLALGTAIAGPLFQGELVFEKGPERIETGWWDGGDIRRDYYVTSNPQGMRLWIFRDCRGGGWYLHGLFG